MGTTGDWQIIDLVWDQAKMKVGDGGLGLRSALDHSIVAYTASVCGIWDLVERLMNVSASEIEEEKESQAVKKLEVDEE